MTTMPWFRLYNEILSERKIERIRRMTKLPRVVIRGAWVTLLAMANDSPQRGCLMWTGDLWITEQEICDDLEMEPADFAALLSAFKTMEMISEHSEGMSCTNFGKRQFKSDNSTARVQAFRARQQGQDQAETEETPACNVSETFPSNAPERETDPETDPDLLSHSLADEAQYSDKNPPPAVRLYGDQTRCILGNWDIAMEVHRAVGTGPPELKRWHDMINAWLKRGYRKGNIEGMLDWFKNGIPKTKGRRNNGSKRTGSSSGYVPELATGFIDEPAREPLPDG
ncbi:MAG TPA: phage replisome organizer N-terminal domain-containing protein [Anaerolineae bacterium]|nr:phage replisome organizer N-terminal domain-containing protein [Anaerolineae bacterium]